MPQIISHRCLIPDGMPDAGGVLRLDAGRDPFPADKRGLSRSTNRAAHLMAACVLPLEGMAAPEGLGVYCAVDAGAGDHAGLLGFLEAAPLGALAAYSKHVSPKWGLQNSVGIPASVLSILLGAVGGVHTFHHHSRACHHALAQAQTDLKLGVVRQALVVAASSAEDPLMTRLRQGDHPGRTLSEGAAFMLLATGADEVSFPADAPSNAVHYGAADPLIQMLLARAGA